MITTKSIDKLAHLLSAKILDENVSYIGIDGINGAGKSTLAENLSKRLGTSFLSLDNFIAERQGGYVPFLDIDAIRATLKEKHFPIIIEGVCLLSAAERIGIVVDVLIYVKRMSPYGHWRDEEECNPSISVDNLISKKEAELRIFSKGKEQIHLPELVEEIIRYHARYDPINKADFVYERIEV